MAKQVPRRTNTVRVILSCYITHLCPTLCNPMDCSMPGFLVHHQVLELCQLMSIESVMPSNHFILCQPLLLLPSMFPSIRVFSESVLCIRWPKYWSFNFSISPSDEYSELNILSCYIIIIHKIWGEGERAWGKRA